MPLGPRLAELCQRFEPLAAEAFPFMDNVCLAFIDLTAGAIEAPYFLKHKLMDIEVVVNNAKRLRCRRLDALLPQRILHSSGAL